MSNETGSEGGLLDAVRGGRRLERGRTVGGTEVTE
jgi:hypothetical protein